MTIKSLLTLHLKYHTVTITSTFEKQALSFSRVNEAKALSDPKQHLFPSIQPENEMKTVLIYFALVLPFATMLPCNLQDEYPTVKIQAYALGKHSSKRNIGSNWVIKYPLSETFQGFQSYFHIFGLTGLKSIFFEHIVSKICCLKFLFRVYYVIFSLDYFSFFHLIHLLLQGSLLIISMVVFCTKKKFQFDPID